MKKLIIYQNIFIHFSYQSFIFVTTMNTFYIVLIVAAVLAVVFALLWFCYICQSQDESKYQDTRVPNVDDVELGLEKRPARNPQIGIKRNRALIVREVLEKDIPIPKLTKKKHVYSGSSSQVCLK